MLSQLGVMMTDTVPAMKVPVEVEATKHPQCCMPWKPHAGGSGRAKKKFLRIRNDYLGERATEREKRGLSGHRRCKSPKTRESRANTAEENRRRGR